MRYRTELGQWLTSVPSPAAGCGGSHLWARSPVGEPGGVPRSWGSTARLSAAESSNERGGPAVGLHQAASEGQLDLTPCKTSRSV
ncbi:uncharacterized protein ColSpa_04208 [Colletotrichum spaethianum]|uniref:Uncharacterized protein n=1 Tax=Colletotrichum spaethianum TaxID=700344 RepID=A0AA37L8Z1_9PEZI|nr:uncharacterized protein ColSpa_04208 [Colletotrichum spaethianum]GKT44027.1 hypothetical protein ColSpa_04208 [Colletotrichum spaethianum]